MGAVEGWVVQPEEPKPLFAQFLDAILPPFFTPARSLGLPNQISLGLGGRADF